MLQPHGGPAAKSGPEAIAGPAWQMLRALLDGMPDPATLFDLDTGRAIHANGAARALPAEVRCFLNREALRDGAGHDRRLGRVLECVDAAGRTRAFESTTCRIGPIAVGPRLMTHVARDVTARLQDREDERLPSVGVMTAGLAHELRTPLTSISNGARALRDMLPDLDGDGRFVVDLIAKEAGRAATLLADVLSLARPRLPRVAPADLRRLVRDAVAVARRSRPEADAVAVEVVAEAGAIEALIDADQVMQALLNIILNALEASAGGRSPRGPRVTVRLEPPDRAAGLCRVTVLDTGPGIAPEDRPRLFEPFFSRKRGGTGLGLAITRRIVEVHGGRLEVQDAPSGGAAFTLYLPAAGWRASPDGGSAEERTS
ncbi:MAG TPA: ATP-binding protein [Thermodesulfobacteriota bacterium]